MISMMILLLGMEEGTDHKDDCEDADVGVDSVESL